MNEMLFHYYAAFVARVVDGTRVQIWLQHPRSAHIDFDLDKTIIVDIDKTPSNPHIQWEDIEIDDFADHEDPARRGFTTLGPVFPHNHGAVGVYLSQSLRDRQRAQFDKALEKPGDGVRDRSLEDAAGAAGSQVNRDDGHEYEQLAFVRKRTAEPGPKLERFHGFHRVRKDPERVYWVKHAGASASRRPPCPVIIKAGDALENNEVPDWEPRAHAILGSDDRTRDSATASSAGGHGANPPAPAAHGGEAVYLLQSVAADAGLDIPKKPTASGEGLLRITEVPQEFLSKPSRHGPLNVFGNDVYGEVSRIKSRLGENYIEIDGIDLARALERIETSAGPFTSLDLIGHSRGRDGVLRISGTPLTPKAIPHMFTAPVEGELVRLGITVVRFLGCRTATSPTALDALRMVRAQLRNNIEVRGTSGDVFAVHYARRSGFMETRLLAGRDVLGDSTSPHQPVQEHRFPPAADSHSTPEHPDPLWIDLAQVAALRNYVEMASSDADPAAPASVRVVFIDGSVVRAFDLIPRNPSRKEPRPELDSIRCNFRDEWHKHRVTDSAGLYALLRGSRDT